jgi:hypothetical protein
MSKDNPHRFGTKAWFKRWFEIHYWTPEEWAYFKRELKPSPFFIAVIIFFHLVPVFLLLGFVIFILSLIIGSVL